ncbi:MAG: C40 family peptidase [Gammaproteobacteria bacterium]|nr:C40 family peptidase [Gammaproteobacteria bacterium]
MAAFLVALAGCSTVPKTAGRPPPEAGAPPLVGYALSLRGTPYRYGGDSPRQGFDCSGFVRHVYRRYGIALPRDSASMARVLPRVLAASPRPGDLVFFNTRGRPDSHVGIYVGQGRFVHAPSRATGSVRVSNLKHRYWHARLSAVRRPRWAPPAAAGRPRPRRPSKQRGRSGQTVSGQISSTDKDV